MSHLSSTLFPAAGCRGLGTLLALYARGTLPVSFQSLTSHETRTSERYAQMTNLQIHTPHKRRIFRDPSGVPSNLNSQSYCAIWKFNRIAAIFDAFGQLFAFLRASSVRVSCINTSMNRHTRRRGRDEPQKRETWTSPLQMP